MKLYGSLQNRLMEGRDFTNGDIKVGTGVTEVLYSDRHAYEVIAVKDQNHFTIRRMKATPTGEYMSNTWKLESDETQPSYDIERINGVFYDVNYLTKEKVMKRAEKALKEVFVPGTPIEKAIDYVTMYLTEKQKERVLSGKQVKLKSKMNITIGIQQEYYDYSF